MRKSWDKVKYTSDGEMHEIDFYVMCDWCKNRDEAVCRFLEYLNFKADYDYKYISTTDFSIIVELYHGKFIRAFTDIKFYNFLGECFTEETGGENE